MSEAIHVDLDLPDGALNVGTAFISVRRRTASTTFTYSSAYLARPGAYALDPGLPLESGAHHVQGLPGAFADSAPDRWGRRIIAKRFRQLAREAERTVSEPTERDYLLEVSDLTRQGALRFRRDTGPHLHPETRVPKLVALPALLNAAHAIDSDKDPTDALKILLDAGTGSLGGARPKASVMDGDKLAIAKFPHQSDEWSVIAWEAATLQMAKAAKVHVPDFRLERVGSSPVLLLDRFDRQGNTRFGYVSGMTMLQENDGSNSDYLDLLDVIAESSNDAKADREELFRRVAFNLMVNNTDDHMRNHGFLRGKAGWRLSPAFDVNPNPDVAAAHQTSFGGADIRDDASGALMEAAGYFLSSPKQRDLVVGEILVAVKGWRKAALANGVEERDLNRFAEVFEYRPLGFRHLP
jgi:serine/threonine-protein kinase HipA